MLKVTPFLFCLFASVKVFAQGRDTINDDTLKQEKFIDSISKINSDKPLYVVDGTIYEGNIGAINPHNILLVGFIKPPGSTSIYGEAGKNGTLLISTLNSGKEYYQRKLSRFSIRYRNYLDLNSNNDSGLVYILNGNVLSGDESQIIRQLCPKIENLVSVIFIEKFSEQMNLNNPKPVVVIVTKQ